MKTTSLRFAALFTAVLFVAGDATAACVNRFVSRTEQPLQVVTLLTGMLTFQEAQDLAKDIQARKLPPVEWVDESGRAIARQVREIKVVRPMPVGCDGRTSGCVIVVSFASGVTPTKKMNVRFTPDLTVTFEQQSD